MVEILRNDRLPIVVQPDYIRKALKAGKDVLSEKPIAKDLVTARELLDWYHRFGAGENDGGKSTWSVAENFRFLESFIYAAKRIGEMGRVLGFSVRMATFVKPGDRYFGRRQDPFLFVDAVQPPCHYTCPCFRDSPQVLNRKQKADDIYTCEPETSWRKTPSYQGGFLLDGGVHFTAGIRLLLASASAGEGTYIENLSAHTAQLQSHLPPADTVDATMKTNTGVTGSFSVSFGTTLPDDFEYRVACERGSVTVREGSVAVRREGREEAESREFPDEGEGVMQEVEAWAKGIVEGGKTELRRRQNPEEALADLEVVSGKVFYCCFFSPSHDVGSTICRGKRLMTCVLLVGSHVKKWRERGRAGAIGAARCSQLSLSFTQGHPLPSPEFRARP